MRSTACGRAVQLAGSRRRLGLRLDGARGRDTKRPVPLQWMESSRRQERKDRRAQAGHIALGNQDGFPYHVGVHLIEHGIALRNTAAVDDAAHRHAVLFHAFENHAGVESGALDCGKKLVLRGVRQPPAERDAAQFRIHQHRAVAVIPGEAQQSGLPGAVFSRPRESSATGVPARRAIASKMSPVAERPASMPMRSGPGPRHHTAYSGNQSGFSPMAMMQVDVPTTFTTSPRRTPAPMASQCASNAPTGIGMPARSPSFAAHRRQVAGDMVGSLIVAG